MAPLNEDQDNNMKIIANNLSKNYYTEHQPVLNILNNINLEIESGGFVTLTGPSGAGKSTLLHILGTLDYPTSGNVTFDETDIFSTSPANIALFRNENIGFVFQFHHLLPEFTALENTMMPLLIRRMPNKNATEQSLKLLDMVGLAQRVNHKPGELSGGEQQRVALARALVGEPKILLADEPTGNLDDKTGEDILSMIERINKEQGITVLIVTHNQKLANLAPKRLHLTKNGLE
jgi:lipoprotein-releasing system ATP-binding protein